MATHAEALARYDATMAPHARAYSAAIEDALDELYAAPDREIIRAQEEYRAAQRLAKDALRAAMATALETYARDVGCVPEDKRRCWTPDCGMRCIHATRWPVADPTQA